MERLTRSKHRRLDVRHHSVLLLAILSIPQLLLASDFRGFSWGESADLVKKKETASLVGDHRKSLIYQGRVAEIDVYIVYTFRNDRLIEGSYHNQSRHNDNNAYIDDYNVLKDLLRRKYGSPKIDRAIWTNNDYRNSESEWGKALTLGHLSYAAEWETYDTTISALLWSNDGTIQHVVTYKETSSREKEKKEQDKRILEKL